MSHDAVTGSPPVLMDADAVIRPVPGSRVQDSELIDGLPVGLGAVVVVVVAGAAGAGAGLGMVVVDVAGLGAVVVVVLAGATGAGAGLGMVVVDVVAGAGVSTVGVVLTVGGADMTTGEGVPDMVTQAVTTTGVGAASLCSSGRFAASAPAPPSTRAATTASTAHRNAMRRGGRSSRSFSQPQPVPPD